MYVQFGPDCSLYNKILKYTFSKLSTPSENKTIQNKLKTNGLTYTILQNDANYSFVTVMIGTTWTPTWRFLSFLVQYRQMFKACNMYISYTDSIIYRIGSTKVYKIYIYSYIYIYRNMEYDKLCTNSKSNSFIKISSVFFTIFYLYSSVDWTLKN